MLYIIYRDIGNGSKDRLFISNVKEMAEDVKGYYEVLSVEGKIFIEEER